jgi:cysteinyl-tRNA synthetase
MNVTDVDPKVSARAKRYGVSPEKVSDKFFHQLFTDLSLLDVTGLSLARVSDYVAEARQLASDLLKKGAAYSLSANIYLDTAKIKAFGQMSGMSRSRLNDMRLDLATNKRSPADILLWNTSDDIGYTYKDKTLGEGFPTVHLQDLSVIMALYAGTYHIHGGATDLVYPHHETLLGQLIALTSLRRPVKCWTHVGLLMNKGSKMSNSLGNAIQIRRIHRRYGRNILRLYFLSEHYRKTLHFSESAIKKMETLDNKISRAVAIARTNGIVSIANKDSPLIKKFKRHLENDFDTVGILRLLGDIIENGKPTAEFLEILRIVGLEY